MNRGLVPAASDMPLRRLEEAREMACPDAARTRNIEQDENAIMMKHREPISKHPADAAVRHWRLCWGGTFACALCLVALAVFGLLDTGGPDDGILYEHLPGTFHISLWLLLAAVALAFLDFAFGRSKNR